MGNSFPEHAVLLVDDEEAVLSSQARVLTAAGFDHLLACSDPREVMTILGGTAVSVVLLDIAMPHISGDVLLEQIRESHPDVPVIVVTASEDVDTAVRCMKAGAHDYMVKAVEPSRLIGGVKGAVDLWTLSRRYADLRKRIVIGELSHPDHFAPIITRDRRMHSLLLLIEAIAPSSETVLITGETGTGKELMAQAIHKASGRKGRLVTVNAAGLDDTMLSDTLFGHRKGAYTGAEQERDGLVQQATGGTLLLDEIGDLPQASQIKLLRLIESGEYYQLGSDLPRTADCRFVVATNRDLTEMVTDGSFRRDLYYRLQTHEIRIPPLKERRGDLPLLLDRFLEEATQELGRKRLAVPRELIPLLETHDFPGNIRELRSMVFAAVSRQKEKMLSLQSFREAIGKSGELPVTQNREQTSFPDRLPTLKEVADLLVDEAMKRAGGNQAIAAGLLGITPQALSKRLARRHQAG